MTPFTVGLTGGIGSGKSAAADHFARLGAAIVDSDAVSRELTGPSGAAVQAIASAFDATMIAADGALDRAAMRRTIFADPAARQRLEAILHPMIRARCDALDAQAREQGAPYVIHDIPLLVESGQGRGRFDRIVVVDCPEDVQIRRVMARSGLDAAEVRHIMAAQASRTQRLAAADTVLHNDSDLESLHRQIETLHREFLEAATKPAYSG
ncbi:MAG: dephospho-CoA kinase [Proteobacteria bacterium]|nr:dephospho-CoA kinase [Pseudomonadota bacterium]